jgi:septum formation protein
VSSCFVSRLIAEPPLVLASTSPRRRSILESLELEFATVAPDVDETPLPHETPEEHVLRLSMAKATVVARRLDAGTVIGADTAVLLDGTILGKPSGEADARRMLHALTGRSHEVLTGVTVMRCSDGAAASDFERTAVEMRDLTDDEIDAYVSAGEPLDKAGSYGVQGCGAAIVSSVSGCFYNVVGLPVVLTCRLLEGLAARGG